MIRQHASCARDALVETLLTLVAGWKASAKGLPPKSDEAIDRAILISKVSAFLLAEFGVVVK